MSESIHIFSYKICLQCLCAYHVQIIKWEVLTLMPNFLIISYNPFLYITTIWQSHQHIFFKLKRTINCTFFSWMTSEIIQKSNIIMCSTPFLSKPNGNSNMVISRFVINQNNQILDMTNKRVCIILEILFTDIVQPISGHSRD